MGETSFYSIDEFIGNVTLDLNVDKEVKIRQNPYFIVACSSLGLILSFLFARSVIVDFSFIGFIMLSFSIGLLTIGIWFLLKGVILRFNKSGFFYANKFYQWKQIDSCKIKQVNTYDEPINTELYLLVTIKDGNEKLIYLKSLYPYSPRKIVYIFRFYRNLAVR